MSTVFSMVSTYDYGELRPKLFAMLESLDAGTITSGARVLIKPNLLAPASPDRAMLTHPMVVKAVAEYALQKGAKVRISDSPAMGSVEKVAKESGIKSALEGLDVEFREFRSSAMIDVGEPFNRIEIAEDAVHGDVLINLPKLKTHSQMLLTLGVKNLFGCVVGFRKPQWHLRVGVEREMFGVLLYRIYAALKPSFTILDGILAMEGQGPGKGNSEACRRRHGKQRCSCRGCDGLRNAGNRPGPAVHKPGSQEGRGDRRIHRSGWRSALDS